MNIKIIESAKEDLKEGYYFYESQEIGLGNYFLESLYSDIESLKLYQEYIASSLENIIVFSRKNFFLQSITAQIIKNNFNRHFSKINLYACTIATI